MKLRLSPLALALVAAIAVGGCGDDQPTGNNNLDPTLALNPCDSAQTSAVGLNGFIMSGSGYQGQLVRLDAAADVEFLHRTDDATIIYSIRDTVAIADDPGAIIILDVHMPSGFPGTYPFNTDVGDAGSYVRLELRRRGTAPKVYRSTEGRIQLDSLVNGGQPYGRFCGTLQDTVSRAQMALMSGRFAVPQ
jgi:hypothetical protein